MKISIKNISDKNQRIALRPRSSTATAVLGDEVTNPTLGLDFDGAFYACLIPGSVQNISCAGATSEMVLDDYTVFDERMHWTVIINDEVLVLDASATQGAGVSLANFLSLFHYDYLNLIGLSVFGASSPTAYFYNGSSQNIHVSVIPMNEFTRAGIQVNNANQSGYMLEDGSIHFCLSPGIANT